jgi:Flp pilus assembly protein TadD
LGLTAALYFSPVRPTQVNEPQANAEELEEAATAHNHSQEPASAKVDAEIDSILVKMRAQEMPPMQAVLAIRAIADAHPKNVKANFTLGLMSIQTAQFEKAVARFDAVLKVDAQNAEALRLRAQSKLGLGDTTAAREDYLKALELAPSEEMKASVKNTLQQISNNK